MPNPKRVLARLTTKGAWYEAGGSGKGQRPGGMLIPASEIAGALGMGNLQRAPYLLGLAVFADDSAAGQQLVMALTTPVEFRLAELGYPGDRVRQLCELVVLEVLWPRRCAECQGNGRCRVTYCEVDTRRHADRWIVCGRCAGKGRDSFTQRDAAAVLGISQVGFRKSWQRRADIARQVLSGCEAALLEHIHDQLVEDIDHETMARRAS